MGRQTVYSKIAPWVKVASTSLLLAAKVVIDRWAGSKSSRNIAIVTT